MVVFVQNKTSDKAFSNKMADDEKEERYFSDEDENWTKLQDIASRRRIQNRISQRKRRRRLKESAAASQTGSPTTPPERQSTPKPTGCPGIARSKTDVGLERPNLMHNRTRSTSQISELSVSSVDGDSLVNSPDAHPSFVGSWDQQFFEQAFMSDFPGFEGSTVEFLYNAGGAGILGTPGGYASSSSYSPAMSYASEGSINGLDDLHVDPKLTNDYDDLFNSHIPFNNESEACNTPPQFDYSASPPAPPPTGFPFPNTHAYPTPPTSTRTHSAQNSSESGASTFTDTSGNMALHLAAEKGHMGIVQLLLDTGIDINAVNKESQTCLHIAVAHDNVTMAGLLMDKGALADAQNGLGQNALHIAVEKGNTSLVGLVLDYISDVDARDCLGQTAFHRAVAMGWEEIVRLMLVRGVNSQAKVGGLPPPPPASHPQLPQAHQTSPPQAPQMQQSLSQRDHPAGPPPLV